MFNNAVGRRGDIPFQLFFKASRCYATGQQEEELVAEMVKRRRQAVNEAEITPQFFKIILFPHASKLHIPDEFVMKYGANMRDLVSLEVPSGAIWKVKLQNSNGMAWLKEGWDQFKEYYSIGCGYFLLFQYNGNSHFSVSIFDLSASEIEYPSGPSEDMTPENFVKIVGDASHRKKERGPETNNNACDDIVDGFLRMKTAKVTKVADHSYSRRQKSGVPEWQDPIRMNLEKPDVEEDLYCATDKVKRKEIKKKLEKQNMEKNLYHAADKGKEHCKEVLDPPASKMTNTSRCNKRKYSTSLEAPHCRHPLRSKSKPMEEVKLDQSKTKGTMNCVKPKNTVVADSSHSGRQKTAAPISCPETIEPKKVKLEKVNSEEDFHCAAPKARRGETNMEKLEKQDVQQNVYAEAYKFKEHSNEVPVVDPSASKMATANQQSEKKTTTNLDASCCRYPLRRKQLKEVNLEKRDTEEDLFCAVQKAKKKETNRVKLDKGDAEEHCNEVPVVDPSAPKMTTANQHTEKKTATSLDESHCRYPLRSKQLKDVNIEKRDLKGHCNEVSEVDLSASKMTTTNRHTEKKTATSLDASWCRYPLRSKQLKDVKIEKRDLKGLKEHCNEVSVVDLSASKMTTTNRHTEKKTATSLDASWCRYPLRSKQLKDVKIEKRDVEEHCNKLPVMNPSASKMTTTNQHSEKKTATSLDVSPCRYPLRSKKEVKLEQWGGDKNMHNLKPKNKVVTDSPYCRRQNSGLPASSPSFHPERKEPIRVKLEKPDVEEDLFCASQKAKMKVTNNVKLEIGDVEGNLNSAAYKVKASEMTNTWQEKGYTLIDAQCSKLGNPYFIVSMQPTHVSRNFHLNIPCNFFRRYFKEEETIVVLRASDGRTWRARCSFQSNCARIHSPGWREFALDNGLKVHDTCVFELMEGVELVLYVTIFRADSCFLKDSLPFCSKGFRACTSTSNSQAL
ncbi:PREDICTED: uncharacterized protein LOC109220660 isoform X2 [Nicotiana attenuata]|uniref:uncharacterized protein LOC109220660 isoform X2 n=1 Tax=Nicotiana attenuata TaxID=49451 RepID=UPI00090592FC|nr:PREDICTED: uncharacterized protein LOC109220660 isoform X2 [Nicotiana attenuata]